MFRVALTQPYLTVNLHERLVIFSHFAMTLHYFEFLCLTFKFLLAPSHFALILSYFLVNFSQLAVILSAFVVTLSHFCITLPHFSVTLFALYFNSDSLLYYSASHCKNFASFLATQSDLEITLTHFALLCNNFAHIAVSPSPFSWNLFNFAVTLSDFAFNLPHFVVTLCYFALVLRYFAVALSAILKSGSLRYSQSSLLVVRQPLTFFRCHIISLVALDIS